MPIIGSTPSTKVESDNRSDSPSDRRNGKRSKTIAPKRKNVSEGLSDAKETLNSKGNTLLSAIRSVPKDWITLLDSNDAQVLIPLECTSYKDLKNSWRRAMKWRTQMEDVLSVMISIAVSTVQQGDQLYLMVVGNASGGKSQFCDGMSISNYCYKLESLTGFLSGYKDEEGNDYSVLARANRKCMITSEGDVLLSNPGAGVIMAQARRMFDGSMTSSYKNLKEDRNYEQLRIPWIIAGTPAMLEREQASLGDRFLKIFLDSPPDHEKKQILQRVSNSAWNAVGVSTDDEDKSITNAAMLEAQRKLAGYIDYLRNNIDDIKEITCDKKYFNKCEDLALLTAILRARPPKDEDIPATIEEPHRLNHQFIRLMRCLTFTMERKKVDDEVMRKIKKVALDTGKGIVVEILTCLADTEDYMTVKALSIHTDRTEDNIRKVLSFLRKNGIIILSTDAPRERTKRRQSSRKPLWGLSEKVRPICEEFLL